MSEVSGVGDAGMLGLEGLIMFIAFKVASTLGFQCRHRGGFRRLSSRVCVGN